MRGLTVLLLSLLAIPAESWAQTDPPRGSVAGIVGAGRTWDDEGGIGNGVAAGGRVEWRLFGTTAVEGSLDLLTHERSGGAFQADGTSLIAGLSLIQRFGRAKVQPYVLGGVHLIRHDGHTEFDGRVTPRKSTDSGFHFGGGLAFRVSERIEIGPEARFYIIQVGNDSSPAWADWFGVRVGFSF
jgi:opacity protein-like surface antigen